MLRFLPVLLALLTIVTTSSSLLADPLPGRDDGNPYELFETDYRWLEIEDVGEIVGDLADNTFAGPYEIGFSFPYYGRLYEQVYICANGMIGFGPPDEYERSDNRPFPDENEPNNIIALYWKNLNPRPGWGDGTVIVGTREGKFVIQYQQYPEVNDEGRFPQNTITMQAVLEPDGDIILQYREIGEAFDLSIGTIGLENRDGTEGLTVRHDGEGAELAAETAFLLSDHGPGTFLVWDGGLATPSGVAEVSALRAEGHSVTHLQRRLNQALPAELDQYEAVFVNLGNFGENGRNYYELTAAEGRILADFIVAGGSVYLEGSDTWTRNDPTLVHGYFGIRGQADGRSAAGPVEGVEGGFAEGMVFDEYRADDNDFIDHLVTADGGQVVLTFRDGEETAIGMISTLAPDYRSVGASIEFGGLVDGENGEKRELMRRIVEFFRTPEPEFPRPINLRATAGDTEVLLEWDMPNRLEMRMERIGLEHRIAALIPRVGKPSLPVQQEILILRGQLNRLGIERLPQRDDLFSYTIYINGDRFDETDGLRYTAIELMNGRQYEFAISANYRDPEGESELSDPVFAVPTQSWQPGVNQTFEQNNGGLIAIPGRDGWEWGTPAGGAANGQRAWATVLNGPYPNDSRLALVTPPIDLPEQERIHLGFNHSYNCEAGWDGGRVEYSPDGGERWEVLTPLVNYPEASVFSFDGGPGYSGNSGGWRPALFDLTALAGQEILVKFGFNSDADVSGPGWFIDDLRIFIPQTGNLTVRTLTENDERIAGVRVILGNNQFQRHTDINGDARFINIPAGNYLATASRIGYVDEQLQVVVAVNRDTLFSASLDEYLGELTLNVDTIEEVMENGDQTEIEVTLANGEGFATDYIVLIDHFGAQQGQGGGPIMIEPMRNQPWSLIKTIDLTAKTGDQYIIAADFVRNGRPESYNLVTAAGSFGTGKSRLYLMNRSGDTLRSVEQGRNDILAGWGVRDLAYDENFLYGSAGNNVFRITPSDGAVFNLFTTPLAVNRAITWINGDSAFWVGDRDDSWYRVDKVGVGNVWEITDRVTDHGLTGVVGMAWNPSDPDGAYLYIHNQESENGGAALYRFNPTTHELIRQMVTAAEAEGFAGGAFTTYLYNTHTWMLGVVIQGRDRDIVKLYELWPRRNWITMTPTQGQLAAGANVALRVNLDATGIVNDEKFANIEVHDLRRGTIDEIPAILTVEGGIDTISGTVTTDDGEGDIEQVGLNLNGDLRSPAANGDYLYPDLVPGRYRMTAQLEGYEIFATDSFDIGPDENLDLDIELQHIESGIISGRVRNVHVEDGWLRSVEVAAVQEENDRVYGVARTGDDGSYGITVPVGVYTVTPRLLFWIGEAVGGIEVADDEEVIQDFTMNDRLPVEHIQVNTDHDTFNQVTWLPPGTFTRRDSLRHDSQTIANAVYLRGRQDVVAVRFEPEGIYDIESVQAYFLHRNDLPVPLPQEFDYRPVYYRIWLEDPETGLPGEEIWGNFNRERRTARWQIVPTDERTRFLSGAFYVGWHPSLEPNEVRYNACGLDEAMDHPDVTHLRIDGEWRIFNGLPGDVKIRATILNYLNQAEQQIAPRPLRGTGDANAEAWLGVPDGLVIASKEALPGISILGPEAVLVSDDEELPHRDPPSHYKVLVDGELAANDVVFTQWNHVAGSDNENRDYTYNIIAVYDVEGEDDVEIPSRDVVAHYNSPPGLCRNVRVVNDGVNYEITWGAPPVNADNSQCVDYAGARLFLNGELMATVEFPEFTFAGQIENGEEGWYDLTLVAFDEVPNFGLPMEMPVALGTAQYFPFDRNNGIFTISPFGSWQTSNGLANGPGAAHSPSYAWGTRPTAGQYDNNANWSITTINEYVLTSPNPRLEFFHWIAAEAGRDGGQVLISVEGGAWQLLTPPGGYPDQTVAAFSNQPAFTGTNGDWEQISFDLGEYEGRAVRFRWLFKSDATINWYPGWYIDDLVIWGGAVPQMAQIYGVVRDQTGAAVVGATVEGGRVSTQSGQGGAYRLTSIIPREIDARAFKGGYVEQEIAIDLNPRDSVEVNFEIYRPVVTPEPDLIEVALGGNDRFETTFTLTNQSNIAVPYSMLMLSNQPDRDGRENRALRAVTGSLPSRDEPGDRHFDWNITAITTLQRIMGVEYAGDRFYLTSADPVRGHVVSILNRDGQAVGQFAQPQAPRVGWGLRDLAWDGEFLYGSQNDTIYRFSTQGVLDGVQLGAPLTVNRALAYDEATDGFWCGEYDSPWYLVDRDGEIVSEWDAHGLTGVYGFAIHPADPDGLTLYASNLEADGTTTIYRANPGTEEIEPIYDFDGPPTGLFITGLWDANRWIMATITGSSPQRLIGTELGHRVGWVSVSPIEGEIEAGAEQEIAVEFAVPPGAQEGEDYTADIHVRAFNGTLATVHVALEIVEGFRHFDEPVVSDEFASVLLQSVNVMGREPLVGSEIAVMTPDGRVGGAVRWVEAPAQFRVYGGEDGFEQGDSLAFVVWDAGLYEEYRPIVEYVQGDPIFNPDVAIEVRLAVEEPASHVIHLAQGWNLISSYVIPFNRDIPSLFDDVNERDNLVLIKDGMGRFWLPRFGFNGLQDWDPLLGYQVNVDRADSIVIVGEHAATGTHIPLVAGWNTVGYLLDHSVDPRVGFDGIMEALLIAKNGRGDFMAPPFGFFGLEELTPGEGYKLKMERAIDLVYSDQEVFQAIERPPARETDNSIRMTGVDMSLLIKSASGLELSDDVEFIAVTEPDGRIVGMEAFSSLPLGIVVRGDDTLTSEVDGARAGDKINVMAYRGRNLLSRLSDQSELPRFEVDGFAAIELRQSQPIPGKLTLGSTYPNPFNGRTTVRFGLPINSNVRGSLIDLEGRQVWSFEENDLSAGWHLVSIDASQLPTGVYWIKVTSANAAVAEKIVLIR